MYRRREHRRAGHTVGPPHRGWGELFSQTSPGASGPFCRSKQEKVSELSKRLNKTSSSHSRYLWGHQRNRFCICKKNHPGMILFAACEHGPQKAALAHQSQILRPTRPPPPLPSKANTSASAACWGKSLPAELDRSPAALPPPRQQPSLTRSLPLPAFSLTLTPSAGAKTLPEWTAGYAGSVGGGQVKSGSPKQQSLVGSLDF